VHFLLLCLNLLNCLAGADSIECDVLLTKVTGKTRALHYLQSTTVKFNRNRKILIETFGLRIGQNCMFRRHVLPCMLSGMTSHAPAGLVVSFSQTRNRHCADCDPLMQDPNSRQTMCGLPSLDSGSRWHLPSQSGAGSEHKCAKLVWWSVYHQIHRWAVPHADASAFQGGNQE